MASLLAPPKIIAMPSGRQPACSHHRKAEHTNIRHVRHRDGRRHFAGRLHPRLQEVRAVALTDTLLHTDTVPDQ